MKLVAVIALSLIFVNFFGATSISNTILLSLIALPIYAEINRPSIFKNQLIAVVLGLICSILSCYFFRNQPIFITFKNSATFFYILFYFTLKYIDLSISKTEISIIILTIVLCLCYILQYLVYPTVIFSGAEKAYEGDIRIRLVGQGFSSLGYFLGVNKYLKTKNILYAALSFLCFTVILLMGFRTMMAMLAIFTVYLIIKVNGFNRRILLYSFLALFLVLAVSQLPVVQQKINDMLARQETQTFGNKNYIRIVQLNYFYKDHFKNFVEFIFGSGYPSRGLERTAYGDKMQSLLDVGINWVDFGLLSISWIIGIPTVIAMIAYSIRASKVVVPKDYYYLKIWFLYLLSVSFTTAEFIRPGNFIVQALAIFLVEKIHKVYKKSQLKNEGRYLNVQSRS